MNLRPLAHFTARDTWLNDPNGLVYHQGIWHLFFQNNPYGATPAHMSWGHATSIDLVTWTELPVAILSSETEQIFSGSAVVDTANTAGFAGPGEVALVAIYTSAYTGEHPSHAGRQAQSLAYSVDEGRTWVRYAGNPVLDRASADFRDPKVLWFADDSPTGGYWVMVAVEAQDRHVLFYRSGDLKNWSFLSSFGPARAAGGVWECPDLFPLMLELPDGGAETRWVLIVSLNPGGVAGGSGVQYFVGDFDGTTFTTAERGSGPGGADWLDYGRDYYAPVSFFGAPDQRRITIGWASNWDYAHCTPTQPWRSAMSLARELTLVRTSGGREQIRQRPLLPDRVPGDDRDGLIVHELTIPPGQQHRIVLANEHSQSVTLLVDPGAGLLSCDRGSSGDVSFHRGFAGVDTAPLPPVDGDIDLTIVIDGCVVEVFACDGAITLTQLVFPSAALRQIQVHVRKRPGSPR